MSMIKRNLYTLLFAAALPLLGALPAFSAGMIEIYADYGDSPGGSLYSGVDGNADPGIDNQTAINLKDLVDPLDFSPPEGRKMKYLELPAGSGAWGIYFNQLQNLSEYAGGQMRLWLQNDQNVHFHLQDSRSASYYTTVFAPPSTKIREITFNLPSPAQFDFTRVKYPFLIKQAANSPHVKLYIDHIRWLKPAQTMKVFPATAKVNPHKTRMFTVEAYDENDNFVALATTFTLVNDTIGTLTPAPPERSYTGLFKAGSSLYSSQVKAFKLPIPAGDEKIEAFASIEVTNENLDRELGLLSESISDFLVLGGENQNQNSHLDVFFSRKVIEPKLQDTLEEVVEGRRALKTTIKKLEKIGEEVDWAGWTIRWGAEEPEDLDNKVTQDMSDFYDGSLRFWFKGPAELKKKLMVGIRSGNVLPPPHTMGEVSKDLLDKFAPAGIDLFDDQWHPVVIPLAPWAGSRPLADLSRIKSFFTISVGSTTSTDLDFYVDNLRWDTRIPAQEIDHIHIIPAPYDLSKPLLVPLGTRRTFAAIGYDVHGATVDFIPTWDIPANLGAYITFGNRVRLNAADIPASGTITASYRGKSTTLNIDVKEIIPTEIFNVYSDLGIPGTSIGISTGPRIAGQEESKIELGEVITADAPEGEKILRSTFTLKSDGDKDAWAVWFIEDPQPGRFMKYFETGFLRFQIKTAVDLEVSIRASTVEGDDNRAKVRLGDYGILLDNQWNEVIIPLYDFKFLEPELKNFESIKTYFAIGGTHDVSGGDVSEQVFDIDQVQWLSVDERAIDDEKIYQGLKEKITPSGLLRSYGLASDVAIVHGYTYDQALAAMAFIYRSGLARYNSDLALAEEIFGFYKEKAGVGAFGGFPNAYNVSVSPPGNLTGGDADRVAGPNAFLLLSLIHYRNVSTSDNYDDYDGLIQKLATWLRSLQDDDGAIRYGVSTVPADTKSTEHNLDVLAAFRAYAKLGFPDSADYVAPANRIEAWLRNEMYNDTEDRFNVGKLPNDDPDRNKALDVYAFPPLVLNDFETVLLSAVAEFQNTQPSSKTSIPITGFDFGDFVCDNTITGAGENDAVWFEGTAQMALAFKSTGNVETADFYLNEIRKGVFYLSDTAQGIAYASNAGTPYGRYCPPGQERPPDMNANDAAVSSMAWYLFAVDGFNPFMPSWIFSAQARKIADNSIVDEISWGNSIIPPLQGWRLAESYVEIGVQALTKKNYFVVIYTHNTNPAHETVFIDPTPPGEEPAPGSPHYEARLREYEYRASNPDSNPAGLLLVNAEPYGYSGPALEDMKQSSVTLPMAWSIRDQRETLVTLKPAEPNDALKEPPSEHAPLWFYMQDINTPEIIPDLSKPDEKFPAFDATRDYVQLYKGIFTTTPENPHLAHFVQGDPEMSGYDVRGFYPSTGTDYLYFQALFTNALSQAVYKSHIYIDLITE
jgi:cellulose synthase operon protein B